jgi:hypothetical protein
MAGLLDTTSGAPPLVGAQTLLDTLFPLKADRPSVRWLQRLTKARAIPSLKIGGKRFYKLEAVREALDAYEISALN